MASTGAFAAGCLLTQSVTLPWWRRAATEQHALRAFRRSGPATGAVLFPLEALATGLLAAETVAAAGRRRADALPWGLSTAGMAGTLALLPLFFARANRQLLRGDLPPGGVTDLLASWGRWNRARTLLAVLATASAYSAAAAARPTHTRTATRTVATWRS